MQDTSLASQMLSPPPFWAVSPYDTDWLAWAAIAIIGIAVYFVLTLYAKFDQWAEHKSEGTPLAKTIPTMLTIALLYEIFPLDHFNILLPLSALLLAVMADWMRAHGKHEQFVVATEGALVETAPSAAPAITPDVQAEASAPSVEPDPEPELDNQTETVKKDVKSEGTNND
jgi:hypothetical protein